MGGSRGMMSGGANAEFAAGRGKGGNPPTGVAGTWLIKDGNNEIELELKVDGAELTGTPVNPQMPGAIEKPPFYSARVYPAAFNTQGGPRRNARCQVVNPDNQPIPGLYSAGELGSFWGWMYNGGGNNAEALCTGRIASRNIPAKQSRQHCFAPESSQFNLSA